LEGPDDADGRRDAVPHAMKVEPENATGSEEPSTSDRAAEHSL
jgi:hypothetical protein